MIIPTANELIANGSNRKLVCSQTAPSVMKIMQPDNDASDNCPSPYHPEPVLSKMLHS